MCSVTFDDYPKKNNFILVANWKMHGSREKSLALFQGLISALVESPSTYDSVFFVVCPPSTLLISCFDLLQGLNIPMVLGAQNGHWEEKGAFTGELSVPLLRDAGARAVILGHSERRQGDAGESNKIISKKAHAALRGGLIPIVCVGEEATVRQQGEHDAYITHQIDESLPQKDSLIKASSFISPALPKLLVAYEPCWAIGTGRIPTADELSAMAHLITQRLKAQYGDYTSQCAVLYGGSVTPQNIGCIRNLSLDGILVGGASLILNDFLAIARACAAMR